MLLFDFSIKADNINYFDEYHKGMVLYMDGKYKEAFKVFNEAYKNGDKFLCAFQLAEFYFDGIGCTKNLNMAFKLHLEAALNDNPYAAYSVAMDYYNGYGCEKNNIEAFKWNKIAAESGMVPQAANNYASMLAHGEGCKKNMIEAFKWFLKAADGGDSTAQYTVGMCYYYGSFNGEYVGVKKDKRKAKYYLVKSAEQGNPYAAVRLDELF